MTKMTVSILTKLFVFDDYFSRMLQNGMTFLLKGHNQFIR